MIFQVSVAHRIWFGRNRIAQADGQVKESQDREHQKEQHSSQTGVGQTLSAPLGPNYFNDQKSSDSRDCHDHRSGAIAMGLVRMSEQLDDDQSKQCSKGNHCADTSETLDVKRSRADEGMRPKAEQLDEG